MELFVLLQEMEKGTIEFVIINDGPRIPQIGDEIERDSLLKPGVWNIAKIFVGDEKREINALLTLMGQVKVKKLFAMRALPLTTTAEAQSA